MSQENDMIAARALLILRETADAVDRHKAMVLDCDDQESMTAILFGLGDLLQQKGLVLEKLATRSHGGSIAPVSVSIPPPSIRSLPSSIPPGEEPEEEAYHSFITGEADSGVRKTSSEHPARKGLKL